MHSFVQRSIGKRKASTPLLHVTTVNNAHKSHYECYGHRPSHTTLQYFGHAPCSAPIVRRNTGECSIQYSSHGVVRCWLVPGNLGLAHSQVMVCTARDHIGTGEVTQNTQLDTHLTTTFEADFVRNGERLRLCKHFDEIFTTPKCSFCVTPLLWTNSPPKIVPGGV